MRSLNSFERVALSGVVLGAVGYGFTYGLMSEEPGMSEYRAEVSTCAQQLGSEVKTSEKVPAGCEGFNDDFMRHTVETYNTMPSGTRSEHEIVTTYVLPSADSFTRNSMAHFKKDYVAPTRLASFFGCFGLVFGSGMMACEEYLRKERQTGSAPDQGVTV